jgi:hypothetical protein
MRQPVWVGRQGMSRFAPPPLLPGGLDRYGKLGGTLPARSTGQDQSCDHPGEGAQDVDDYWFHGSLFLPCYFHV